MPSTRSGCRATDAISAIGNGARIRGENCVRCYRFHLLQHVVFHAEVFKHRLDDQIDICKPAVVKRRSKQRQHVVAFVARDLSLAQALAHHVAYGGKPLGQPIVGGVLETNQCSVLDGN